MKISKEKLKQIIKEELALAELDNSTPSEDSGGEENLKTKSEFSKKFLELSKQVRDVSGLDANEMQVIMSLTVSLIKLAGSKSAGPILKNIETIVSKKIGTPQ